MNLQGLSLNVLPWVWSRNKFLMIIHGKWCVDLRQTVVGKGEPLNREWGVLLLDRLQWARWKFERDKAYNITLPYRTRVDGNIQAMAPGASELAKLGSLKIDPACRAPEGKNRCIPLGPKNWWDVISRVRVTRSVGRIQYFSLTLCLFFGRSL